MLARAASTSLLLLAAYAQAAPSEDPGLLSEDAFLADVPKVLTVSRLAQPLSDAPSAVTVIDRATIKAAGIFDIAEVFRLVPGMYVGYNAGFQHNVNPVVSYHGMTDAYARRMQVLIDGRSVYSPLFGGVAWSDLPLAIDDIERIEVTRGPNAASHGANAFLGVINIITRHAMDTVGESASLTHGNGRNEAMYRHGGKEGDLYYRITAGYREDDGLSRRADGKRTELLTARFDYRLTDTDELEFQFGYNGGRREEGLSSPDEWLLLPRTKSVQNYFVLARWQRALQNNSDLRVQFYHAYENSDDRLSSLNLGPLLEPGLHLPAGSLGTLYYQTGNDVTSERYDLEAQHTVAAETWRLAWGGSLRLDQLTAPMYLNTSQTQNFQLARMFANLEWHPIRMATINAGAMAEHNNLTGTDLSPRASLNLHLFPGHTLRFGVSSATRTPTQLEEKFNWRIAIPTNPGAPTFGQPLLLQPYLSQGNLAPERITSREIGYLGSFGGLSLDARLYHDKLDDLISSYRLPYTPVGGIALSNRAYSFRNRESANVHGFEAQAQWKIDADTSLLANYAHTRTKATDIDDRYSNTMPTNTWSLLATHRFSPQWSGSLAYYQVGEVNMMGDADLVKLSRRWDASISRRFSLGQWHGELSAVSQNLFDNHYHEFARYNTMQRRTFVNLKLDF